MFETYAINYKLNGGTFERPTTKKELKRIFLTDFYYFIASQTKELLSLLSLDEFLQMKHVDLARFRIGSRVVASYYLAADTPMHLQPHDTFIGYCLVQGLYSNLIGHLTAFFYRWRDLEEVDDCSKEHAINFYYFPWASLVDTIKYFNYEGPEDIINAHDSGICAKDQDILLLLKTYPQEIIRIPYKTNRHLDVILPRPYRAGFSFCGWYKENQEVTKISKHTIIPTIVEARWEKIDNEK